MILEEAAYIAPDTFYSVIIPIIEVGFASVIAISTPGSSTNYYSLLGDLKTKSGQPVFSTFSAMPKCELCQAIGAEVCPHNNSSQAYPWKTAEKREIVTALYSTAPNAETMIAREIEGKVADSLNSAFESEIIDRFKHLKRDPTKPRVLFVGIDPAGNPPLTLIISLTPHCFVGGGAFSNWATCAVGLSGPDDALRATIYLVSDEAGINSANDIKHYVFKIISSLRAKYAPEECALVFGIESNLGNEAEWIDSVLTEAKYKNTFVLRETKKGTQSGILTTNDTKLQNFLFVDQAMRNNNLLVSTDLIGEQDLNVLINQMRQYKKYKNEPTSAFSQVKVTFTGKVDDSNTVNARLCDDLILSLQLAIQSALLVNLKRAVSFPYDRISTR